MRYGEDDPTLWPQQYTSKFHHLEAIVKRKDFEQGNTILCSLGKLVYSILCLLEEAALEVKGETISPLFGQLVESMCLIGIINGSSAIGIV
ncbi:hypothetical protein K438DRAFT_1821597 [Mycena galopus ATCC 62051]|nr:hypothetical protein K438DRAFT_1821597 [Mycena galopus ATCC 62051]